MLWDKNRKDPKIGVISPKDHTVVNRQFVAGVAVNLIICIALLMSGAISPVVGESLIAEEEFEVTQPKFLELTEPEFLEVSEPEFLEVSEPEFLEVSEPKSLKVSEPKILESGRFPKGKYTPAERENVEYLRCAKEKGFSNQLNCMNEALGITQE